MSLSPTAPPKQSLGQNYLVDRNLAAKLVAALPLAAGERVVEIGAGTGALTDHLLARGARPVAVEIDGRLIPQLAERYGDRVALLHADILQVDLTALARERGGRLAVVGNLPFYLSSPILFHLVAHRRALSQAALILQRELVDRICADPGGKEYGSLTIHLGLFAARERLFRLPASVFRPRPKVDAAALRLDFTRPSALLPRQERDLERVVRAAFGQRRKTLRNALSAGFGKEVANALLAAGGIDGGRRGEQLTAAEYVGLADALTALDGEQ